MRHENEYTFQLVENPIEIKEVRSGKSSIHRSKDLITNHLEDHHDRTVAEKVIMIATLVRENPDDFTLLSPYEILEIIVGDELEKLLNSEEQDLYLERLKSASEGDVIH